MARPVALLAALAASLLAVSGAGSAATQQTPKRGGTIVMGTLFEPSCANTLLGRCSPATAFMNVVLRGAFRVGQDFTFRPDLVSRADLTTRPPFTITYHIRPEARWSDGVPITAQDFVFTYDTARSMPKDVFAREEWASVRSVRAVDRKTVRVTLRSRVPLWCCLFAPVLPAHALRGEDVSAVWLNRIHNPKTGRPIGSGPFLLERWERGRGITLVRNPRYWGRHLAYLDRIVGRFARQFGATEQVERLRSGELDVLSSDVLSGEDVQVLRREPGVGVRWSPGPLWEHFSIRIGAAGHPALERKLVRRALAYGIDRGAIARELFGAVDSRYPPSDGAIFSSLDARYRQNWSTYRYRPAEARRLLEREGCRAGPDGIYACSGERLSVRFVTTGDDPGRVRTLELVQGQLRRAGVEAVPQYATRAVFFGQILPSGTFDVVLFSFIRTFVSTAASHDVYGCGGFLNVSGYCQRLANRDLDQARRIIDPVQQARVLNRADAQLAKDVPVIPLVQRPSVVAFKSSVRGVVATPSGSLFDNAENWWLDR